MEPLCSERLKEENINYSMEYILPITHMVNRLYLEYIHGFKTLNKEAPKQVSRVDGVCLYS